MSYLRFKLWNTVPESIKDSKNVNYFETKIKIWKSGSFPCRLCKVNLPQIGLIWLGVFSKSCSRFE